MGDTAVIDFEGFDDGKPFEGGKGEDYSLEIGSGSFVPGFEDQLIGLKAGDEKDLDITFPEDYVPDLAGKSVVFKVKVNEVKERQEPALDDEFAKDVSEFDTLDEFKKDLKEKLKARRQQQAERDYEAAVIDALLENLVCDVPEAMVDYRADKMVEEQAMRMQQNGLNFQDYLKYMGLSMDDVRAQAKTAADRAVRTALALDAVAKAEGIEVTQEELDAEVKRLAEQFNVTEEQVREVTNESDMKQDLGSKKALELVKASAKKPAKKKEEAQAETTEAQGE